MIATLLGFFQQGNQRGLGVGNDTEIRLDHVTDLGSRNIDVDELPLAPVYIYLAGVPGCSTIVGFIGWRALCP